MQVQVLYLEVPSHHLLDSLLKLLHSDDLLPVVQHRADHLGTPGQNCVIDTYTYTWPKLYVGHLHLAKTVY